MKNPSEKLAIHNNTLGPLLEKLRQAFIGVVNQGADIAEFAKAVNRLDEFRQFINGAENIGFVVGVDYWRIAVFPLIGDPEKDIDQMAMNLQKSKMN